MSRFTIVKDLSTNVKRFNLRGRKVEFKINAVPDNVEPVGWIKSAVQEIVQQATKGLEATDKVGITFCGKSFEERGPGWINFKNAGDLTMDDVWEMISKIFQSNSEGLSTDTFCLNVTSVRLPQGKGRGRKYNTFNEECIRRRGIVTIKNNDGQCLPRALVVAMANVDRDPHYENVRRDRAKIQSQRASELTIAAKITIPPEGAGIPELRIFQEYLPAYKIVVYQYGTKGRDIIFEGTSNSGKHLNLLYHEGHYNVIVSLTAAFCCSYFCENCHTSYNTKNAHRCGGTCPCCQQSPACPNNSVNVLCKDCNRNFRGQQCIDNHRASGSLNKKSVCEEVKRCVDCLKTFKADRAHVCGEYFCKICDKHVPQDHLCHIQSDKRKPKLKDVLYIFYDLETRQEKVVRENTSGEIKEHEPNLCVFQQRCDNCLGLDSDIRLCGKCGVRLHILKHNSIQLFLEFVTNQRKLFKNVVVIAHNGQSFDHQFMLNYILHNTDLKPDLIMRGTKIILMCLGNIKFIDSLNYFPMALSKLPKAFDLPATFKKGYFPHLFNTTENADYIGPLPPVEYYSPDTMKTDDREAFLRWYNEYKSEEFNMQRDIVEYCKSDVQILTEACLKFRKLFLEECNVEPFLEATTIASACNLVYRRNFLKPDTIGIIPKNGYRFADNQSKEAIQWLVWEEDQRQVDIRHTAKEREAVVAGVKVDGFCAETKQVFEFHGCYYHGHPLCLQHNRDSPLHNDPKDTLNLRHERTVAKTERLRSLGYEVIEMWACEFDRQTRQNPAMKYLRNHPLLNTLPLSPRETFYGGRTGNTTKYYKCQPGEKIKYIDVCSLYPYVCKYGKFPIHHPKVHVGHSDCAAVFSKKKIDGLIKCRLMPPENLQHPVLPMKQNNKLMFTLCHTCSDEKKQNMVCPHTDEERALTGTWVIDEVQKAIERGYEILEIYELWEYETIQYNRQKRLEGLFTKMMDKFIKMKQQASGWPTKCRSESEKERYIEEFHSREDISLEFSEIVNNPGLRSLAKLMLNSFWGKFGQRENQQKTTIIDTPAVLYELLLDPAIEITNILQVNENNVVVHWEYREEAADSLSTVNVCIAAYTTTQARLKLYSYLEQLGDRVLYYDTDSVIYVSREGEYEPPTGEFIGDMTDELECYGPESYISEFVSGGPKNYAYKVLSTKDGMEKVVCKVKGINLNYTASQHVNFETIRDMILSEDSEKEIRVLSHNIRRTKDHQVLTVPEVKRYRLNAEKRVFLEDCSSNPYGYKRQRTE